MLNQGRIQRGAIGETAPLYNLRKVALFTIILYKSEDSIRDIRSFCRTLFCQGNIVKYASSLLQS